MAKVKKKLSKSAKTSLKLLKDSKMLTASKTAAESRIPQSIKPPDISVKTSAPNKMKPAKKRG